MAAIGPLCAETVGAATTQGPLRPSNRNLGTEIGPTKVPHISFPVLLRSESNPVCLKEWARGVDLSVDWSPDEDWARVTGPPAAIDRAFDVSIDEYRSQSGQRYFAANRSPVTPLGLCHEVTGTGVLHSYQRPTNFHLFDVPDGGLRTQQLLQAYDATPLTKQGYAGQGETIVFFETDGFNSQDLSSFVKLLPAGEQKPFNVQVVGGDPTMAAGATSESELDMEIAHEIAPDAKIVYINMGAQQFANDTTSQTLIDAFTLAERQWPGAIWSASFGLCESDGSLWNSSDLLAVANAVLAAENKGATMFAASGDSAGLDCAMPSDGGQPPQQSFVGVSIPAALPSVTAVGGTSLSTTANGDYVGETTWSEPLLSQGTGGGVSQVFAKPSWQTGPGTGGQYDPNNTRQVPDVASDADPETGIEVFDGGQAVPGGGTSAAAPTWAGFTALMDQFLLNIKGCHRLGFFNPTLYGLAAASQKFPPFHDVTIGGNDLFPATPGYDMATGLGSPDVWNLTLDLVAQCQT